MKKMICAAVFGLLFVSVTQAFFGRGCNTGCNVGYATGCATACAEQTPPICTKTIQVPRTIMETKVITVPAIREVIPQPALCRRIPQPAKCIRVPQAPLVIQQPDRITYEAQPDKVEYIQQAPLVRYKCPVDAMEGYPNTCATSCAPVEASCAPCA
jgi:hypothetical protein